MKRIVQSKAAATSCPSFTRLTGAVLLAIATCAAPAAMAETIDFDNFDNQYIGHGDWLETGNFMLTGASNASNAQLGALVGAIYDGTDPDSCGMACPTNNTSNYYAALNDGIVYLDPLHAGQTLSLKSFEASFIGYAQGVSYPAVAGLLRIQGWNAAGTSMYEDYYLSGPTGGSFKFQNFQTSATFGSQQFSSMAFFGFTCSTNGSCNAFSTNKGQFALDNIVASVPEPSTYAMLLLGLAGIGFAARRRNQA